MWDLVPWPGIELGPPPLGARSLSYWTTKEVSLAALNQGPPQFRSALGPTLELPRWLSGKEPACQCRRHKRHRFDPWVRKISWRRAWQPTSVFLPGETHGQRSLAGYSTWGHKELDTTEEWLSMLQGDALGFPGKAKLCLKKPLRSNHTLLTSHRQQTFRFEDRCQTFKGWQQLAFFKKKTQIQTKRLSTKN